MKKAIYTIGLFSLVMILTSFTKPEANTPINVSAVLGTARLDRAGSSTGGAVVGNTVRLERAGSSTGGAVVGNTVRLE